MSRAARFRVELLATLAGVLSCSPRLATTQGPFRDLAQPGPCVLDAAGAMQCWGGGKRVRIDVAEPRRLISGRGLVCAEPGAGGLRCWSKRIDAGEPHFSLFSLEKLAAPTQLVAHANGYCAVQADGRVMCASVQTPEPRAVPGVSGARQVDLFVDRACALLDSGKVLCWSSTPDDPAGSKLAPEPVTGLEHARQIALGSYFGCAALEGGRASCWGSGNMGELGRAVTPFVDQPAAVVPGLSGVAEVVAAQHTACARTEDGKVWCWGRNMACELGIKKRKVGDLSETPLAVPGLEPSQKLSLDGNVACSLSTAGNLTCWGGCLEGNDPSVRLDRPSR